MKDKSRLKYWWLLLTLFWMGLIFFFSSSRFSSPHTLGWLARFCGQLWPQLSPSFLESLNWGVRKGAHLMVYLILSFLIAQTMNSWKSRPQTIPHYTLGFSVIYAFTDEIHQFYSLGRTTSLSDIFLDSLGALAGLGIYIWMKKSRGRGRTMEKNI